MSEDFYLFIDLSIAALVAGICFFHVRKRFQHQLLCTAFQIFCLVVFILFIGYLVYLLRGQMTTMKENEIKPLASGLGMAAFLLLPIPLIYYSLQPSDKWWKWPLKKGTMLLAYISSFSISFALIAISDNAIAFYNPIPTNLRFLLLLTAGIVLGPALWSQFYAYLHPQKKWLTVLGLTGVLGCTAVYSSILYFSLIAFWDNGTFTFSAQNITQRVVFYYEISDTLTLLLAFTAAGFAIVWAINWYKTLSYIKSGVYSLLALFLVSSSIFYFRAYMSMLPFFTVVIGGMLLFIHSISTYIKSMVLFLLALFLVGSYIFYFPAYTPNWGLVTTVVFLVPMLFNHYVSTRFDKKLQ